LPFEQIFERYHRPTLLLAYRMLGDWHDAEEIAQETLLKAYLHVGRLRDPAVLGSWLRRVTRNRALDTLAARRRRPATVSLTENEQGEAMEFPELATVSAEALSERAELRRTIGAALAQLDPDSRAALVLHAVYGYTYEEVAARLEIGLSAAKMRIARARSRMRCRLHEERPATATVRSKP
jgi:RNA polymerase sigma-70 factor (ECF subfamily)